MPQILPQAELVRLTEANTYSRQPPSPSLLQFGTLDSNSCSNGLSPPPVAHYLKRASLGDNDKEILHLRKRSQVYDSARRPHSSQSVDSLSEGLLFGYEFHNQWGTRQATIRRPRSASVAQTTSTQGATYPVSAQQDTDSSTTSPSPVTPQSAVEEAAAIVYNQATAEKVIASGGADASSPSRRCPRKIIKPMGPHSRNRSIDARPLHPPSAPSASISSALSSSASTTIAPSHHSLGRSHGNGSIDSDQSTTENYLTAQSSSDAGSLESSMSSTYTLSDAQKMRRARAIDHFTSYTEAVPFQKPQFQAVITPTEPTTRYSLSRTLSVPDFKENNWKKGVYVDATKATSTPRRKLSATVLAGFKSFFIPKSPRV